MKQVIVVIILMLFSWIDLLATARTIVVLPFVNLSKNQEIHWVGEGLSELLQERLEWPKLKVIARQERIQVFEQLGLPNAITLSRASLIKIGEQLKADWVVVGQFHCLERQLRISFSVLDPSRGFLSSQVQEEDTLDKIQHLSTRLGWRLMKLTDPEFPLELEFFTSRFKAVPNAAFEHYIRGLMESDKFRQLQYLRQADRLAQNYSAAIFQLGRIYHEQKAYSNSSFWFNKLFQVENGFEEGKFFLGLNHLYLKEYEKAALVFRSLNGTIPLREVYGNLGIALARQGAHGEGTYWLEQAAKGNPRNSNFHFNLAYNLWRTRKFKRALESLSEMLKKNPADSEAHYLLYKCFESVGRSEEATKSWKQALKLKPAVKIWKIRKYTPDLYRVHERIDRGSFRKHNFREDAPEHFWNVLKEFRSGRLSQAEQKLVQLISKMPEDADAHLLMAKILQAKGNTRRAISELKVSVFFKDSVEARVFLSELYFSIEQFEEANTEASVALSLDPKSQRAREILDLLKAISKDTS